MDARTCAAQLRLGPQRCSQLGASVAPQILLENKADCEAAQGRIADALLQRLVLKPGKIQQLVAGIRSIAQTDECLGKVLKRTELAEGLILEQQSCAIGVCLVIFEARPDALPQASGPRACRNHQGPLHRHPA